MQKKLLSILLTLCMLLGMFPFAFSASAAEDTTVYDIEIGTAEEFVAFAGDSSKWASNVKLSADINLSGQTYAVIGNGTTKFTGTFNGDGHTISNFTIAASTMAGYAMFGQTNGATIKNLTIKGTEATDDYDVNFSHKGCAVLVGYAHGSLTIENCTSYVDVKGSDGRVGAFIGLWENDGVTGYNLTVKDCVNYGDIIAGDRAGGIIGAVNTNNPVDGSIYIDNCINYGDITATNHLGGIVGRYETKNNSAGVAGEWFITNCANYGAITANNAEAVGGIVGLYSVSGGANAVIKIDNCLNKGDITGATGKEHTGGVVGFLRAYPAMNPTVTVSNLMNTGAVNGWQQVGGIIGNGTCGTSISTFAASNFYNAGTVTASNNAAYGNVVGSITAGNYDTENVTLYYTGETIGDNTVGTAVADATDAASFGTMIDDTTWAMSTTGPQLVTFFHEHSDENAVVVSNDDKTHTVYCSCFERSEIRTEDCVDDDSDDVCDLCGYDMACAHANTTDVVVMAATCTSTGTTNVVCDDCGATVEEKTTDINASNHASDALELVVTEDGEIQYVHTCCDAVRYSDALESEGTIYVSETSGIALNKDTDFEGIYEKTGADIGNSADAPFASFATAMQYAAAVSTYVTGEDVTVRILDTASTGTNQYYVPACENMITITGGTLVFTTPNASGTFIRMYGPLTFENITFSSSHATFSYRGVTFFGRNNKLVLGEGITNDNMYFVDVYGGSFGTESDDTFVGDITIRSGAYRHVGVGDRDNSVVATGTLNAVIGATGENTLTIDNFYPFAKTSEAYSADAVSNIIVDGAATIKAFYATPTQRTGADYSGQKYDVNLVLKQGADITGVANEDGTDTLALVTDATTASGTFTVYANKLGAAAVADAAALVANDNLTNVTVVEGDYTEFYCVPNEEHADNNSDNLCDACGANMACTHEETVQETVTAATCTSTGIAQVNCASCGAFIENVTLDVVAANHTTTTATIVAGENGTVSYAYACCGAAVYTETAPDTVYVSVNGGTFDDVNTDFATSKLGSKDAPFASFETAMQYAAAAATAKKAGVTVEILDTASVSTAQYYAPASEYMITVTGGTLTFANGGTSGAFVRMYSPLTVENIELASAATTAGHRGVTFFGRNNKLVLGEGITCPNLDFIDAYGGSFSTESDAAFVGDITIRSGAYRFVGIADRDNKVAATGTLNAVIGATGDDTLTIQEFYTFGRNSMQFTTDVVSNVVVDGAVTIQKLFATPTNRSGVDHSGRNYTVNFVLKQGADITGAVAEDGTETLALTSDAAANVAFNIYANQLGTAAVADAETLIASDTFDNVTATADSYAEFYCVPNNEHVDGDDEGTLCDNCGEDTVAAHEHSYYVTADNTYFCATCGEELDAPTASVVVAATPATAVNGTVTVPVKVTGSNFWGTRFTVTTPEGLTLTACEAATVEGWIIEVSDDNTAVAVIGNTTTDNAIDATVVTLTFTVDEDNTAETAIVVIDETINADEEAVDTVAIGAEVNLVEEAPSVAFIGETGYATVQEAVNEVTVLGTVTVVKGTVETVTPNTTFYFEGDVSGITIAGTDYVMDVTGRYTRNADGEIITDPYIPYTPSTNKAIVRPTATTEVDSSVLKAGASLMLEAAVEIKYTMPKTTVDGYADFYAVINMYDETGLTVDDGANTSATKLVITDKVDMWYTEESVADSSKYVYVFNGTPAKNLNNKFTISFYAINADGSVTSRTVEYGTSKYLYTRMSKSTDEVEKTLMASILNYGALAQQHFDYNTDNLLNATLQTDYSDYYKAAMADFEGVEMAGTVSTVALDSTETALFRSTGIALLLDDKINITMGPNAQDGASTDYTNLTVEYKYTDIKGEEQVETVPFEKWEWNESEGKYYFDIDTIAAMNLRQELTVNIYSDYGTESQSRVIKTYVMDGAEYYCTLRQSKDNATEIEKTMYYAMMAYCDAAQAMFK